MMILEQFDWNEIVILLKITKREFVKANIFNWRLCVDQAIEDFAKVPNLLDQIMPSYFQVNSKKGAQVVSLYNFGG